MNKNLLMVLGILGVFVIMTSIVSAGWFSGNAIKGNKNNLKLKDHSEKTILLGGEKLTLRTDIFNFDYKYARFRLTSSSDLEISEKEISKTDPVAEIFYKDQLLRISFENFGKTFTRRDYVLTDLEILDNAVYQVKGGVSIGLNNFKLKDGMTDINLLYSKGNKFVGLGKDPDDLLRTNNTADSLIFDRDTDDYFVASHVPTKESYLMRAANFRTERGENRVAIEYKKDRTFYYVKYNVREGDVIIIGNVELSIGKISMENKNVSINAMYSGIVFDRLYSTDGKEIVLPSVREYPSTSMVPTENYILGPSFVPTKILLE